MNPVRATQLVGEDLEKQIVSFIRIDEIELA